MTKPIAYICSPYAGDTDLNTFKAQYYSKFATNNGYLPIAPHLLFPQFLNDNIPSERTIGLDFGMQLLTIANELWVFGEYISSGMKAEIEYAKTNNYLIRYFTTNCEELITCRKCDIL